MGSDWSLEELMSNVTGKNAQDLGEFGRYMNDVNYHPWVVRVKLPILYEFTQDGEFGYPYHKVYTYDCEYVFAGWLVYSPYNNLWEFQGAGDWPLSTKELRLIADELDELNAQLLKERTWLDRLFNM